MTGVAGRSTRRSLVAATATALAAGVAGALTGAVAEQRHLVHAVAPRRPVVDALTGNPFAGNDVYNAPGNSPATAAAKAEQEPGAREGLLVCGRVPQGVWLTTPDLDRTSKTVRTTLAGAVAAGDIPVFVLYNIPNRDLGSFSAGGAADTCAYIDWLDAIIQARNEIPRTYPSVIVLEPDAVAEADQLTGGLSGRSARDRFTALSTAVTRLTRSGFTCYIDAGHSGFGPTRRAGSDMASRLIRAGIADARGFSTNVANFQTVADETSYGRAVAVGVDGLGAGSPRQVIDTSRNGSGPWSGPNSWCNPPGRSCGPLPGATGGDDTVTDAYLWIKVIGYGDGNYNGGPESGQFDPTYALGCVERSKWYINRVKT